MVSLAWWVQKCTANQIQSRLDLLLLLFGIQSGSGCSNFRLPSAGLFAPNIVHKCNGLHRTTIVRANCLPDTTQPDVRPAWTWTRAPARIARTDRSPCNANRRPTASASAASRLRHSWFYLQWHECDWRRYKCIQVQSERAHAAAKCVRTHRGHTQTSMSRTRRTNTTQPKTWLWSAPIPHSHPLAQFSVANVRRTDAVFSYTMASVWYLQTLTTRYGRHGEAANNLQDADHTAVPFRRDLDLHDGRQRKHLCVFDVLLALP